MEIKELLAEAKVEEKLARVLNRKLNILIPFMLTVDREMKVSVEKETGDFIFLFQLKNQMSGMKVMKEVLLRCPDDAILPLIQQLLEQLMAKLKKEDPIEAQT